MRSAIVLVVLEPRPGVDPDPDGCGLRGEVGLGGDAEAVGEGGDTSLRGCEDVRVIHEARVGRPVLEEPRVRVLEPPELRFDILS